MEKRNAIRVISNVPVKVVLPEKSNGERRVQAQMIDLSTGGARLRMPGDFSAGTRFTMHIFAPELDKDIQIDSEAVWRKSVNGFNDEQFDYGVAFSSMEEKQEDFLQYLITKAFRAGKVNSADVRPPIFAKCYMVPRLYSLKLEEAFMRETQSAALPKIKVKGKELVMLGCNSYLGLSGHPKVRQAMRDAVDQYGTSTSSSRMFGGGTELHNVLERKLAKFEGGEDAMLFNAGYLANVGTIPAIVGKGDYVIVDDKAHASIIDGCMISRGSFLPFRHNDMKDLEKKLQRCEPEANKLIITEGVFSMDGDIGQIDGIVELAEKYNAGTLVDDAHATGVLGEGGRGSAEHFGLKGKIDLTLGTLSKSLAGLGGFVIGKKEVITFLRYAARSYMFSLSLPIPIIAGLLAALEVIQEEPEIRANLRRNVNYLRDGLQRLGFDTAKAEAALIPVVIGDDAKTGQVTRLLEELGVFVNAVVYPAVRKRESRLRLTLMATHTIEDLDHVLWAFERADKKLGLVNQLRAREHAA
jgi:8-amino-7-oxononanoate synthase